MTDDERDEIPQGLEQHLLVYVRDPGLWPVLAVVVLIAGTLFAAVLVYALALHNLFAMAALAVLLVASGHALLGELRERRFGLPGWIVVGLWLSGIAVALASRAAGIF